MKKRNIIAVLSALVCFALCQQVQAAPVPETPDPGAVGGSFNTADGDHALFNVTTGIGNAAFGWFSLLSNTDGAFNTGVGAGTLLFNIGDQSTGEGVNNTAVGTAALLFNTTGHDNVAVGIQALIKNVAGPFNTAVGIQALKNATANANTAVGDLALVNVDTGFFNTAIGAAAGISQTNGHNNIYIGQGSFGVAGESNACYIQSIQDQNVSAGANPHFVFVDDTGKLGTNIVSADGNRVTVPIPQSQLQAVPQGQPKAVPQYSEDGHQAMLNLKVEKLQATVAQQHKQIETLTAQLKEQAAQIQKVSAQLELNKPASRTVVNK
jgi:hypothetical protein